MSSPTEATNTPEAQAYRPYLWCLLVSLTVVGGAFFATLFIQKDRLPPPPFTGSISFDEKAVWLSKHFDQPCDVLAIGSSMTLNNLDSEVFAGRHFLNAGSWGLKIDQTDYLLSLLLEYLKPKVVLVVTAPTDFERDYRGRKIYDETKLRRFFTSKDLFRSHLDCLYLTYLVENYAAIGRDRHGRRNYYSLDFDSGGSVPIDPEGLERDQKRWMKPVAPESSMDPVNYEALGKLAKRCADIGIQFLLVQPPIRKDILSETDIDFLTNRHWPKLAAICQEHEATFDNQHGVMAADSSVFVDSTHLNAIGAQRLSQHIFSTHLSSLRKKPKTQ